MPVKCKKGKPRYRRKDLDKKRYLQFAWCNNELKEAKIKSKKTHKTLRNLM